MSALEEECNERRQAAVAELDLTHDEKRLSVEEKLREAELRLEEEVQKARSDKERAEEEEAEKKLLAQEAAELEEVTNEGSDPSRAVKVGVAAERKRTSFCPPIHSPEPPETLVLVFARSCVPQLLRRKQLRENSKLLKECALAKADGLALAADRFWRSKGGRS